MKKIMIAVLASLVSASVWAGELTWLTDLPKALEKAKAEKRMVLLDFTGSHWCPPCKALHKNVLTAKECAYLDLLSLQGDTAERMMTHRTTAWT